MAHSISDEQALLQRARGKDRVAFGLLVAQYQGALERILLPLAAGSRDRARDWSQDAILRAWRGLPGFREGNRFSAWFFRIGVNLALTAKRREALDLECREAMPPTALAAQDPAEQAMMVEDLARLRSAMASLPERYQRILRQRYLEGRTCAEIAEASDSSPNAVSIVLFRAKERLKSAWSDQ